MRAAWRPLFAGFLGVAGFAMAIHDLRGVPRVGVSPEMEVVLPRFVQVAMAGGDRYLAANLAGFRVLVADSQRMSADNYRVQAELQKDVAWLNPAHEDNFYIAAALLPWNNEVDAAQYVLGKAMAGRPFDWTPAFYYAFNQYHFKREPAEAARLLLAAAERASEENDRLALQNVAANWFERGYEPAVAASVVDGMAEQSRSSGFKKYLKMRAARMRDLAALQVAAQAFEARTGRVLRDLSELVAAGLIPAVPVDPLGLGYAVNAEGRPFLLNPGQQKR